jgi:hypothetical protein
MAEVLHSNGRVGNAFVLPMVHSETYSVGSPANSSFVVQPDTETVALIAIMQSLCSDAYLESGLR